MYIKTSYEYICTLYKLHTIKDEMIHYKYYLHVEMMSIILYTRIFITNGFIINYFYRTLNI